MSMELLCCSANLLFESKTSVSIGGGVQTRTASDRRLDVLDDLPILILIPPFPSSKSIAFATLDMYRFRDSRYVSFSRLSIRRFRPLITRATPRFVLRLFDHQTKAQSQTFYHFPYNALYLTKPVHRSPEQGSGAFESTACTGLNTC